MHFGSTFFRTPMSNGVMKEDISSAMVQPANSRVSSKHDQENSWIPASQNDGNVPSDKMLEDSKINQHDDADEDLEDEDEFALSDQVCLAGFKNKFGNLAHGFVNRKGSELRENGQPKKKS